MAQRKLLFSNMSAVSGPLTDMFNRLLAPLCDFFDFHRGRVYFISDGVAVKIGYTGDSPVERMAQLQTGNPRTLRLLGSIPGSIQTEHEWHRIAKCVHIRDEWFEQHPLLMERINTAIKTDQMIRETLEQDQRQIEERETAEDAEFRARMETQLDDINKKLDRVEVIHRYIKERRASRYLTSGLDGVHTPTETVN